MGIGFGDCIGNLDPPLRIAVGDDGRRGVEAVNVSSQIVGNHGENRVIVFH